jgi:hypothetical protein
MGCLHNQRQHLPEDATLVADTMHTVRDPIIGRRHRRFLPLGTGRKYIQNNEKNGIYSGPDHGRKKPAMPRMNPFRCGFMDS